MVWQLMHEEVTCECGTTNAMQYHVDCHPNAPPMIMLKMMCQCGKMYSVYQYSTETAVISGAFPNDMSDMELTKFISDYPRLIEFVPKEQMERLSNELILAAKLS
jgi:hypothetical protein